MPPQRQPLTPAEKLRRLITEEGPNPDALFRVVAWSTFWDHPSGKWVKAPSFANRIEVGLLGPCVRFGANSFLVGRAVSRCAQLIAKYHENAEYTPAVYQSLKSSLDYQIRSSVGNYKDQEYPTPFAVVGDFMKLGSHGIYLPEATKAILYTALTLPPPNA